MPRLGVLFDQELRWKEHIQRAVKQTTVATLGMSGLRHLRPAQMRQIYQACILPKMEYASTVWHNPLKDKMHLRALAGGWPSNAEKTVTQSDVGMV